MALIDFLFRWSHVLFGIAWIGLLYYFNFVQGSYFAEAAPEAKADATKKLVPRALWYFRWGAMFTFLTGVYLLYALGSAVNQYIMLGALMGIFMFLNVWLVHLRASGELEELRERWMGEPVVSPLVK